MRYLSLVFFLVPFASFAQEAKIFERSVISDDGIFGFTLSPDSKTALWVRSKGKRDTLVIVESTRVNGRWQKARLASFSGTGWKDIDPIFTPDGSTVLFQSNRPTEKRSDRKRFDLWAVKKMEQGWGTPYHLGNTVNTDSSESFASIAKNGNIYFTIENGIHQGDIFFAEYMHGEYQKPQRLSDVINTNKRESNPFVSPDEDYFIFAASNPSGSSDSDLFISFRKNGTWTTPVNLGATVNSSISEFCPFVHQQEDRLYFSRLERTPARNIENTFYIERISELITKLKRNVP